MRGGTLGNAGSEAGVWPVRIGGGNAMTALIVLLLILLVFGGLGFAAHVLWVVLVVALVLWLLGFFLGGAEAAGRRRWYGR